MNFKKKWRLTLSILCMILLTACNSSQEIATTSSSVESTSSTKSNSNDESQNNVKNISIDFATNFSDGVATINANGKWYLIDKKGNILFDFSTLTDKKGNKYDFHVNAGNNLTNYCNNTALAYVLYPDAKYSVTTAEDYANTIINKKGEIIWSVEKEGWEEAEKFFPNAEVTAVHGATPFTSGNTANRKIIPYSGYMAVEFEIDSFEYTGSYIGLLDSTGKWVIEPTTPCEGLYTTFVHTENYGLTGRWLYRYDTMEKISINPSTDPRDVESEIANEIYLSEHDNLIWHIGNPNGFYDASDNIVINTEAMGAVGTDAVFEDGYAIIDLENEQESKYLTVIDTTGKQMFSPIKNSGHGNLSEGKFYWKEGQCYLDINGEPIGDITGTNGHDFSEGLAWIRINDEEWHCIDGEGNILF